MTSYTLKFIYSTGNSFHIYTEETILDIHWNNIDNAKLALSWIKDHYRMSKLRESEFSKFKDFPWFVKSCPDSSIRLKLDNGGFFQTGVFWIGHFETLESVEIIIKEEEDDSLIFIP